MMRVPLLLFLLSAIIPAVEEIRLSDGREIRGEVLADGSVIAMYGTVRTPISLHGASIVSRAPADEEKAHIQPIKREGKNQRRVTDKDIGDISALASAFIKDPTKRPAYLRAVFKIVSTEKLTVDKLWSNPMYRGEKNKNVLKADEETRQYLSASIEKFNKKQEAIATAIQEMSREKFSDEAVEKHRSLLLLDPNDGINFQETVFPTLRYLRSGIPEELFR